jgi:protein-tyrosine phosphatase
VNPNWLSEVERRKEVKELNLTSPDQLPWRIPEIHSWVHGDSSANRTQPTIIFFHCEAGSDRTGEVAGSYAMHFLNQTFEEVYNWDTEVAGRKIEVWSENALLYYCWFLTYELGLTGLGCDKAAAV